MSRWRPGGRAEIGTHVRQACSEHHQRRPYIFGVRCVDLTVVDRRRHNLSEQIGKNAVTRDFPQFGMPLGLFAGTRSLTYGLLLAAQTALYGTAALAALFPALKKKSRLIKLGSYFVFMNASVILGFFRFLRGRQAATWEKARRVQSA